MLYSCWYATLRTIEPLKYFEIWNAVYLELLLCFYVETILVNSLIINTLVDNLYLRID